MKARHKGIRQVRIITKWNKIVVQFMYSEDIKVAKVKSERVMGIDLGLNNLATVVSNTEMTPYIINGRTLKSINQYYNKEVARLRKEAKLSNNVYDTKRMCRIVEKRNNKVKDYLHKASRQIISIALENEIGTIIVGNNKGWKQEVGLGKKVNQNFVSIPYDTLIEMIRYKAELKGIAVKVVEESYTSGTSYLDNEKPIARYYNKGRRKHRGLFVSNEGYQINADVNGAYQIIKKDGVSAPIKFGEKVVRIKVA
jgi:putative transposase